MNICVFCAASDVDPIYTEPARTVARLISRNGHTLVWGGSDRGLMKVIADEAQAHGGRVVGISMESLKHTARERADIMMIAKDLAERKALMLEHADAIITLVGGSGTLDEMTELFELKRHGVHDKPMVILNTAGFYNGLREQWNHMQREGFLNRLRMPLDELIQFVDTPEAAMEYITSSEGTEQLPILSPAFAVSPEAV